jgi:hypothetical protein
MFLGENEHDISPIINQLNTTDEWEVKAFTNKEDAINHFQQGIWDVVIFHEAIEANTKQGLSRLFQFQEGDVILITARQTTSIWDDVNEALHNRSESIKPVFTFVDDALKNAKFNINLN